MLNMKGQGLERVIISFAKTLIPFLYYIQVVNRADYCTMNRLVQDDMFFSYFSCARYDVDGKFQLYFRQSGSVQEGKRYFSGNHKAYEQKVEASVFLNGICIGFSPHVPGSLSDMKIFRSQEDFYISQLEKL